MKIGLVCPYDFYRQGGVQKLVEQLDTELTARGHDVRIITPRPRAYKGDVPDRTIFIGQSAKWNTPIKTTLEVGMSLDLTEMEEVLEQEHFDLLHVHEPEVPILGPNCCACPRTNCCYFPRYTPRKCCWKIYRVFPRAVRKEYL